jgi:hypothetical protein
MSVNVPPPPGKDIVRITLSVLVIGLLILC